MIFCSGTFGENEAPLSNTGTRTSFPSVLITPQLPLLRSLLFMNPSITTQSGHRRVPVGFYESLTVPLTSLPKQIDIVSQISVLESKIKAAKKIMKECPVKKTADPGQVAEMKKSFI